MDLKILEKLDPREYEHPLDKKALDALEKTKGLDTLVRKFYDMGLEEILLIQFTGSNLKVTPTSFPDLYELLEETCEILNLKQTPDLYLQSGQGLQGITTGVDKPIIVISTDCIELFNEKELMFVLGREIGHIKSQHVLYHEMGFLLPVLGEAIGAATMGIGNLLTMGLQIALLHWVRMSEYTADRAGLLACQDVTAATMALAKIAGLPPKYYDSYSLDSFVTQARAFKGFDEKRYSKFLKYSSYMFQDQVWTVMRANQFYAWVDAGEYQQVIDRTALLDTGPKVNFCPSCGFKLDVTASFCPQCGNKLGA